MSCIKLIQLENSIVSTSQLKDHFKKNKFLLDLAVPLFH